MNGEWINVSGSSPSPSRMRVAGPSLRLDRPRPPLRYLALRTRRHGKLSWQRGLERVRAGAARTAAFIIARLDAWIWQPVTWPFRPAQREMLARTLAALALAVVAAGWIAAYNTLAPTPPARPLALAPAPALALTKPFTGRVVSHTLPAAEVPIVEVPSPIPALNER